MYLYPLYLCKSYDSLVQNNFFRYIKKTQGKKTNDKFRTDDRYMYIM